MKILGIAGPAGSGKDTLARMLLKHLPAAHIESFATPGKEMLRVGLGLSDQQLHGDLKDVVDSRYSKTPRDLMKSLMHDWGRERVSPQVWLDAMVATSTATNILITPDVRYENEAAWVREHGQLFHIVGRGDLGDSHISAKRLPRELRDYTFFNNGPLEHMEEWVANIVRKLAIQ